MEALAAARVSSPALRPRAGELHPDLEVVGLEGTLRRVAAAATTCAQGCDTSPESAAWTQRSALLLEELRCAGARADAAGRRALREQLDAIVAASAKDPRTALRRLLLLSQRARECLDVGGDRRLPLEVRRHARAIGFRLFDQVAAVRRDPTIERLARRRNAIFVALGIHPRSLALIDWCDVAVRIATGGPLQAALDRTPAPQREALVAAKVRFDLLAIELNITLDDLADERRDLGLFTLAVARVFGEGIFAADTAIGRFFRQHYTAARELHERAPNPAWASYVALLEELYGEVVTAGQALAGERWDERSWQREIRRILGAMMLSLVENERPELLADVDWAADFFAPNRAMIEAANGNRVIFELIGQWTYERVLDRTIEAPARRILEAAFEDLQLAQQIGNCIATFAREIDEGDRSNLVIDRAATRWRSLTSIQRSQEIGAAGLFEALHSLGVDWADDQLFAALFDILRSPRRDARRSLAATCVRHLVDRSDAIEALLSRWQSRVDRATAALDALGFCGETSRRRQIELLLLHLELLKKSPLSAGERL